MSMSMTRKQSECLAFIRQYVVENDGVAPSFDEMKDALELKSKSGVHRLICALENRRLIRRVRGGHRAIEVIKQTPPESLMDYPRNRWCPNFRAGPNSRGQPDEMDSRPRLVSAIPAQLLPSQAAPLNRAQDDGARVMGFTSPTQMRAALAGAVTDNAFLDRMIGEYFKDHKPEPMPKHAPAAGHAQPKAYKAPAKCATRREDDDYREHMAQAARELGKAVDALLRGKDPCAPRGLVWTRASGSDAGMGSSYREITPQPALNRVSHSGPCFQCGAARSCEHRQ